MMTCMNVCLYSARCLEWDILHDNSNTGLPGTFYDLSLCLSLCPLVLYFICPLFLNSYKVHLSPFVSHLSACLPFIFLFPPRMFHIKTLFLSKFSQNKNIAWLVGCSQTVNNYYKKQEIINKSRTDSLKENRNLVQSNIKFSLSLVSQSSLVKASRL